MTLRLVYSRPMAVYVAGDEPRHNSQPSLLLRLVRSLFKALRRSRARAAMRELRRYQHLIRKDSDANSA